MKRFLQKAIFFDLLFVFFISLTPLFWFHGNSVLVGHDNVYALNPVLFLQGRSSTWSEENFGKAQNLIMGTVPMHFIDAIPSLFGAPIQVTQRIVYVFWFFAMGCAMYILARVLSPSRRIFALTAVVLYQFNFFMLQAWWIAERTKFSACVAMPLLLALFIKVYRGEVSLLRAVALATLILLFFNAGGLYGIPLYGGLFIVIMCFVPYFCYLAVLNKKAILVSRIFLLTLLVGIGYMAVSSYFLLPALLTVSSAVHTGVDRVGGVQGLITWADVISANASYANLLRLQGIAEWYDNVDHPYALLFLSNPLLIMGSFIFFCLALYSLIFEKNKTKRPYILYFWLVFLVGIFFASGTHPPFGAIYAMLMKTVPGFELFRSPYYKFASAIFLAISILVAYTIDSFQGRKKSVFFFLLLVFVFLYHFPFFTGKIFEFRKGFSTRLAVPRYVWDFGRWTNTEKKGDGRILFLPPNDPSLQFSMYQWGYLSFQALPTLLTNQPTIINNDQLSANENQLVSLLYTSLLNGDSSKANRLLGLLRISYIVLQNDTLAVNTAKVDSYNLYKRTIEHELRAKKVRRFDKWTVYKIETSLQQPLFVTSSRVSTAVMPYERLNDYLTFSSTGAFVVDNKQALGIPNTEINSYIVPQCIYCLDKDKPIIRFPEVTILPDSPFYPLVITNEQRSLKGIQPKNLIYDYMGISLKRVAEIQGLLRRNKVIDEAALSRLQGVMRQAENAFSQITAFQDKVQVAGDMHQYLIQEKIVLTDSIDSFTAQGNSVLLLGKAVEAIGALENVIRPYIPDYDPLESQLYGINGQIPGSYALYINPLNLYSTFGTPIKVSHSLDNGPVVSSELSINGGGNNWILLGTYRLTADQHLLKFSLPIAPNIMSPMEFTQTEFSLKNAIYCYSGNIQQFSPKNHYQVKITYTNQLSDKLKFCIWKQKKGETSLLYAENMVGDPGIHQVTKLIKDDSDADGITVGVCSAQLNSSNVFNQYVNVVVNEIISPQLLFVPLKVSTVRQEPLRYVKHSPTSYTLFVNNAKTPFILGFLERFDPGWSLSGNGKSEFVYNGYGNGWVINKKGSYELTLTYMPEQMFLIGSAITCVVTILCIGYLFFDIRRK